MGPASTSRRPPNEKPVEITILFYLLWEFETIHQLRVARVR